MKFVNNSNFRGIACDTNTKEPAGFCGYVIDNTNLFLIGNFNDNGNVIWQLRSTCNPIEIEGL